MESSVESEQKREQLLILYERESRLLKDYRRIFGEDEALAEIQIEIDQLESELGEFFDFVNQQWVPWDCK